MYADGARMSVSVATIEFAATADGTALTWTEQGAYLDGFDGAEAPQLRREGTAAMLGGLAEYLAADQAAEAGRCRVFRMLPSGRALRRH
jgi:hypothetical protein